MNGNGNVNGNVGRNMSISMSESTEAPNYFCAFSSKYNKKKRHKHNNGKTREKDENGSNSNDNNTQSHLNFMGVVNGQNVITHSNLDPNNPQPVIEWLNDYELFDDLDKDKNKRNGYQKQRKMQSDQH